MWRVVKVRFQLEVGTGTEFVFDQVVPRTWFVEHLEKNEQECNFFSYLTWRS